MNDAATTDNKDLAPIRAVLQRAGGIRHALVFGSVATGHARPNSDLDIAVEAATPLSSACKMQLIAALAATSGRPVDLIDLKRVGEPLLGQILQHGRRVLGDNAEYAELIRRHVFATEDFMPYVDRMLRERRRAWIG